ncbi:terminase large subunit [Ancylobacter polymorphus]|uniref:Terminase large subunit n=1 Tax=Ancylobacter polymorphus TaxID=223390 RepID=A0A9E6ZU93_9HYPH|nr:terminase TerL endonuclease subunit [Ancylobacter polymorphus]UOK70272.1 terminase large subunit [Ancylobacter polymorphus]UOK70446.1 terminase large subunit [Ancylobacter polymorphus]
METTLPTTLGISESANSLALSHPKETGQILASLDVTAESAVASHPAWLFDDSPIPDPHGKGERAVRFIRALKHPKSSLPGRGFQLDRWAERLIRRVYGDTRPDGTRRIKTVFALIPRGNRKTTLGAALALLHLGPERIPRSQVVSAAVDRDQARIAFEEMTGVIGAHPRLAEAMHPQDTKSRITHKKSGAFYRAMSADAATAHGRTPVFALVDELHAWKKRDLWDAIKTGLVKTPGSLLVITTTAGIGRENVAYDMYAYARQVATGAIEDEAFLPILFEAEPDEDWRDEAVWHRVNPGLSCEPPYPDLDGLRQMVREAQHRPADREMFRQLHLNVWLDGAAEPAWDLAIWDENSETYDLEALKGAKAYLAVDLSKRIDLSAIAACIEVPDGRHVLHVEAFCPEEGIRRRADLDSAPYPLWQEQGFLTACPGDVIDRGMIEERIRALCAHLDVQEINFDPWSAGEMMRSLDADGLPVVEFPQRLATFARPVTEFETAFMERRLLHGGNPVLRWAVGNVVLDADASENRRPNKKKSTDRIDPAVAAIMAVGRAMANDGHRYTTLSPQELMPWLTPNPRS